MHQLLDGQKCFIILVQFFNAVKNVKQMFHLTFENVSKL